MIHPSDQVSRTEPHGNPSNLKTRRNRRPECYRTPDYYKRPDKKTRKANANQKLGDAKVHQSNTSRPYLHTYVHYATQRKAEVPKKLGISRAPLTTVDILPHPAEGVEVVYTNDPAVAESWLKNTVIDSKADALGLDIEWKPQFVSKKNGGVQNKTAVLQLAHENSSLVLHIFYMKSFPKSLTEVLANKSVLKVGSGIKGDAVKLIKDTGMMCSGRVDTQDYANALGIRCPGLKNLSKRVLKIDLNKPKKISMSNWENFPLRKDQITYAALDAWIGLKLYIKMKEQLAVINKDRSEPEVINVGFDEPNPSRTFTCQGCNEVLESKGNFFRHKLRCEMFRTSQKSKNQDLVKGNSGSNQSSDQTTSLSVNNSTEGCSLGSSSRSGCSGALVFSKESLDGGVIICPVFECGVECQGEEALQKHVTSSMHACCKECGKIFRSKVSRNHKKQHAAERKEKNILFK